MPAVQIIPALLQLYPEIEVEHADDTSSLIERAQQKKWTWLFVGRTVHLVAPPSEDEEDNESCLHSMRILHSKNIAMLMAYYVSSSAEQHSA